MEGGGAARGSPVRGAVVNDKVKKEENCERRLKGFTGSVS